MNDTIFQYLDNELLPEERQAFEIALMSDEILQKNLAQEQAIREQFEFQKTKLSVLALHEKKKKQVEEERLIQEQFDFEKTKKEVLALHERKKLAQQKEGRVVTMSQRNNWQRYAIAASFVGLALTSAWVFYKNKNLQSFDNQVVEKPKEGAKPSIIMPSDSANKEEKAIMIKEKPKQNQQKINLPEERLAAENPNNNEVFDGFYLEQMKDIKEEVMSANEEDAFENAAIALKKGQIKVAYAKLEILHKEKPKDIDITLFFALANYKINQTTEALKLLESIKGKNKDVENFLGSIK